jgi:hypothetical protein
MQNLNENLINNSGKKKLAEKEKKKTRAELHKRNRINSKRDFKMRQTSWTSAIRLARLRCVLP